MATSADDCRKFATECLEMAADPKLANQRETLLILAALWRAMADDRAERKLLH